MDDDQRQPTEVIAGRSTILAFRLKSRAESVRAEYVVPCLWLLGVCTYCSLLSGRIWRENILVLRCRMTPYRHIVRRVCCQGNTVAMSCCTRMNLHIQKQSINQSINQSIKTFVAPSGAQATNMTASGIPVLRQSIQLSQAVSSYFDVCFQVAASRVSLLSSFLFPS